MNKNRKGSHFYEHSSWCHWCVWWYIFIFFCYGLISNVVEKPCVAWKSVEKIPHLVLGGQGRFTQGGDNMCGFLKDQCVVTRWDIQGGVYLNFFWISYN
jgi:hypothetical protein